MLTLISSWYTKYSLYQPLPSVRRLIATNVQHADPCLCWSLRSNCRPLSRRKQKGTAMVVEVRELNFDLNADMQSLDVVSWLSSFPLPRVWDGRSFPSKVQIDHMDPFDAERASVHGTLKGSYHAPPVTIFSLLVPAFCGWSSIHHVVPKWYLLTLTTCKPLSSTILPISLFHQHPCLSACEGAKSSKICVV